MANTILIIGNGFDLYHGLPTRYTDFLFFAEHWNDFKRLYDQQDRKNGSEYSKLIDVRLGSHGELILESLEDFASHASFYTVEHIEYLSEHIQNNTWAIYFDKILGRLGKNWIDFEAEIEHALTMVERYYTETLPLSNGDTAPLYEMPDHMRQVLDPFSKRLGEINPQYKYLALYGVLNNKDVDEEILHENKQQLLAFMKEELDVLTQCLNYYLKDFVSFMKCRVYSEQIRALTDVRLLNFNYTYTYKNVYGNRLRELHHPVHGEVKEGNIVLGISDNAFKDSIDYVYFQKYFQRIQRRTGSFYKEWLEDITPVADVLGLQVYIMGHSLSPADQGVLEDVFKNKNVEKITIYYHNQEGYEGMVINLIAMFGKDFVIAETGRKRIVFEQILDPVSGLPK